MKRKKDIAITWTEYDSPEDLGSADRELLMAAKSVTGNAWAPYSGFNVGAALRMDDGTIITGTNVENAAFPSGICAERNVLSTAVSGYPGKKPVALAIAAARGVKLTDEPVSPCGNCRQVIAEEEYRSQCSIRIILSGENKIMVFESGKDLLPLQFSRENLKI